MTEQATAIRRIQAAARKREEAEQTGREATEALRRFCKDAHSVGISVSEIAAVAGLSRQSIYNLLARQRSPTSDS